MSILIAYMLTGAVLFTVTEALLSQSWLAAARVAVLTVGLAGCVVAVAFVAGAV